MVNEPPVVTKSFIKFEQEHILPIPESKRTGTMRSLFAIWVGLNMMPLTVVTGAVATAAYNLPIGWSITAILLGNLIGAFGSALHASQGPHLGVPQMLQARAQFGYRGASLFAVIAFVMFMGFFVSILVVAKDALVAVFPEFNGTVAIIVFAILGIGLCAFGYDLLRKTMMWISGLIALAVAVSLMMMIFVPTGGGVAVPSEFTIEGFFAVLAIGIVWQLAYAPYVSDYTRYLPKESGPKAAFWSTYSGLVLSSIFVMTLGVLLGAANAAAPLSALQENLGVIGQVVLLIFAVSSALINGVELYSAVMNGLTVIQSTFKSTITTRTRLMVTIVCGGVATLLAIIGQGDFMQSFESFLTVLLYVLIPWSAINLIDYFILRRGEYSVGDLFAPDGGKYGMWNARGLVSYAVGMAAQVPFMITPIFTGPLVHLVAEVDIAWLVGFVVTSVVFIVLEKIATGNRAGVR